MNSAVKNSISILHCSTVTLETWMLEHFPNLKFTNYEKFTLPNLHYSLKYYFRFPYVCILTFDFGLLWYLWSQVWITAVQRCSSSSSFVLVLKKEKSVFTCPPPAYGPPSSVPCLHQFPSLDEEPSGRRQQHSLHSRQVLRVAQRLIISQDEECPQP